MSLIKVLPQNQRVGEVAEVECKNCRVALSGDEQHKTDKKRNKRFVNALYECFNCGYSVRVIVSEPLINYPES